MIMLLILCKHRCIYFISHLSTLSINNSFFLNASIFGYATSKSLCTAVISPMPLGEMPSHIPCGSAIETAHAHYGSFFCSCLSFFKVFEVDSPISISRSCFSLLSVLLTSRERRDFPVFSQQHSA